MKRALRRGEPADRGTTLAELAVTMFVFGIFGAFLTTAVVQTTRLARESAVRETTAQRASVLVAQVTKDLRAAVRVGPDAVGSWAFVAAQPDSVTFYMSGSPSVLRERLYVSSGVLMRETQLPDAGTVFPHLTYAANGVKRVQRLGPPDLPHTVTFAYLLKGSTTAVPSLSTALQRQAVAAVEVHVSVDGDGPGGLDPVVLQSTVRPYNP